MSHDEPPAKLCADFFHFDFGQILTVTDLTTISLATLFLVVLSLLSSVAVHLSSILFLVRKSASQGANLPYPGHACQASHHVIGRLAPWLALEPLVRWSVITIDSWRSRKFSWKFGFKFHEQKSIFTHRSDAVACPGSRELRAVKIAASYDAWRPPKR